MKLNKTLMIAALVAGSVFAADVAARAQDSTNTPPAGAPPGGPGMRNRGLTFEAISKQLELTEDQKPKVKPIIEELTQKMSDFRKDTSVAPADRRAKMKEIRDAATAKLKDILTADQLAKWEKMGPGARRPGGAGGPPPGGTPPVDGAKPPQN